MTPHPSSKPQVALLSESLGADSTGELALEVLSLFHSMNWQVLLITGEDQEANFALVQQRWPRTQILSPFSSWSLMETPRVIQLLFDYQPELLHCVCPPQGFSHPLLWLPALTRPLWSHKASCSLPQDLNLTGRLLRQRIRPLVRSCEVVWATHPEQEQALKAVRGEDESQKQRTEIFFSPLIGSVHQSELFLERSIDFPQWLQTLIQAEEPALVFIPGSVADETHPLRKVELLKKLRKQEGLDLGFIFAQGWGAVSLREKARVQAKLSEESLLSFWWTPLDLNFSQQIALKSHCPYVLSPQGQLQPKQPDLQGFSDGSCNQMMRILRNSLPNR